MQTKKLMQKLADYSLNCFKQMFEKGGTYKELKDKTKKYFKIIKYNYPKEKITIEIPMSEQEYNYWRKIKPQLRKGESIENEK